MKKSYTFLVFMFSLSLHIVAQVNYQDAVYLKNGNIIHGIITEQIPNKSLKIETTDENIFFFKMEEIDKIMKKSSGPLVSQKNDTIKKQRCYIGVTGGLEISRGPLTCILKTAAVYGVNIEYLFNSNLGIIGSVNYLFTNHCPPYIRDNVEYPNWAKSFSFFSAMVGPLISIPINKKIEWNFHPMVGIGLTNFDYTQEFNSLPYNPNGTISELNHLKNIDLAYNFGTLVRFNVSKRYSLMLTADYFQTISNLHSVSSDILAGGQGVRVQAFSFGIGVAYRLK